MLIRNLIKTRFINLQRIEHRFSKTAFKKMTEEKKCIVAVCQMTATNNKSHNLKTVERLICNAKEVHAAMVFLPEACDFIGTNKAETIELAENLDGPLMNAYKDLACKNDIWLSIGGFHELSPDLEKDKVYNTHAIIDNRGELKATYRKIHLFDVFIPEKNIDLRESEVARAGQNIIQPLETPAGWLGLSICYDLRFPELSTLLRKMGATILTYPSAFTHATGEAHWETLLRARAIENQCYVIAAAQVGIHNSKRMSYGRAMIVDPWGQIIAECPAYREGYEKYGAIVTAEINSNVIDRIKQQMPVFQHRRSDLYSLDINIETLNNADCSSQGKASEFLFSNITIPNETVFYETPYSFAFTNIRCVLPGHVLIASKRVAPRLKDLTDKEISDLFQTSTRIQTIMENVHNAGSSTIVVQDGKDAGQTIPHVHVHILPRKPGDFQRNDDIYEALAKHDTSETTIPLRELDEMIAEADQLKKLLNSIS